MTTPLGREQIFTLAALYTAATQIRDAGTYAAFAEACQQVPDPHGRVHELFMSVRAEYEAMADSPRPKGLERYSWADIHEGIRLAEALHKALAGWGDIDPACVEAMAEGVPSMLDFDNENDERDDITRATIALRGVMVTAAIELRGEKANV